VPPFDDWMEGVYRSIRAYSSGGYTREQLDEMTIDDILATCEMLIDQVSMHAMKGIL
jgi:hypothetical protein